MSNGSLYTKIQNKVAIVEFYHPASNSLPSELLSRLEQTFIELDTNDEVHVVVLRSEKFSTFCAGASFNELIAIESLEEGKKFFSYNAERRLR